MYADHMPLIRAHGFRDAAGLRDVFTFVLLSIRVPFVRVAPMVKETKLLGARSPSLWGWKIDGWQYVRDNAEDLLADLHEATTPVQAIAIACRVPGVGLVKGGFVAQLLGFATGCLDSRNANDYGIPARAWRTDGTAPPAKRIAAYCAEVDRLGGAEILWDNWCAGLAAQERTTGERISRLHVDMICGRNIR